MALKQRDNKYRLNTCKTVFASHRRRTVLIQKDPAKGNQARNYHPLPA